jgi:hypothetical protein
MLCFACICCRLGGSFSGPDGMPGPPPIPPPPPPPRTGSTSLGLGGVPTYEAELKLLFFGDPSWAVEPVSAACFLAPLLLMLRNIICFCVQAPLDMRAPPSTLPYSPYVSAAQHCWGCPQPSQLRSTSAVLCCRLGHLLACDALERAGGRCRKM